MPLSCFCYCFCDGRLREAVHYQSFVGGHAVKLGDLHAALGSGGKYMGRCAHSILKVHVDPPVLLALVLDLADTDPANFSN